MNYFVKSGRTNVFWGVYCIIFNVFSVKIRKIQTFWGFFANFGCFLQCFSFSLTLFPLQGKKCRYFFHIFEIRKIDDWLFSLRKIYFYGQTHIFFTCVAKFNKINKFLLKLSKSENNWNVIKKFVILKTDFSLYFFLNLEWKEKHCFPVFFSWFYHFCSIFFHYFFCVVRGKYFYISFYNMFNMDHMYLSYI